MSKLTYILKFLENKEAIINLFNENYTYKLILEELDLKGSVSSLGEFIRNNLNLKRIENKRVCLIKDFEKDVIIPWQKGKTLTELGKKLHACPKRLSRDLKALGYNIKSKTFEQLFDNTVFDVIDTEEKAYWLGFIYADGCVESNTNRFSLELSIKDYGHLVKFNNFIKYIGNNVKTRINKQKYKGKQIEREMCVWRIGDKHLKESLIKQGCVPQKSLILKFPELPAPLISHFIRGYFDGDGCVSYYRRSQFVTPQCSLVGTKDMLSKIIYNTNSDNVIEEEFATNIYYSIKYNKKGSIDFLNLIYKDATIYLDRKYKRYLLFKKYNFEIPYTEHLLESVFGIKP